MKGDHQHYIPQHVQRGFKAPGKGRLAKVWLYHCDRPARREATLNVGAQNRFYSSPRLDGVETLDEALTRYENGRLQILLNTLRALEGGTDVEADLAAEVITHLVYRNAHARELLRFGARRLALAASEVFTDEGRVRRMLGLDVARPNPRFAAHIKGGFGRQSLPPNLPLDDDTLGEIAFALGREKFPEIWAKARSEAIGMTLAGLEMIEGGGIRDLHADILGEGPVAPGMANQLVGLRWTVVPSDQIVALPDCIAVAFGDAPLPEPLMASQSASRRAVVMPLTSHCLLVGLQPGADSPDLSLWNLWAAACSATFFIASHQDPELDDYRRYIGGRAFGELERVIESAVADLDQGPTPRAAGSAPLLGPSSRDSDQQDPVAPPSLIPLTLKGFGDEAIAQGLGAAIRDLLVEVDGGVPINRLDGITFASDFGEALATLDRGLNAAPLTVRNLEYGTTMAMSPAVLRDGVVMGHVVCDARIGQSLLCDDPDLRRMAAHTVLAEMARVACLEIQDKALPGSLRSPLTDALDTQRYTQAVNAWQAYFAARASAFIWLEGEESHRTLLLAALQALAEKLPKSRLDYRFHGDTPRFAEDALCLAGDVLQHAASLFGHRDGLELEDADASEDLKAALAAAGLQDWIILLHGDLRAFWDRRGEWEDFEEFLAFNMHVDRLLWPHGLIFSRTAEGQSYLHVPLASDEARLPREVVVRTWRRLRFWVATTAKRLFSRADGSASVADG